MPISNYLYWQICVFYFVVARKLNELVEVNDTGAKRTYICRNRSLNVNKFFEKLDSSLSWHCTHAYNFIMFPQNGIFACGISGRVVVFHPWIIIYRNHPSLFDKVISQLSLIHWHLIWPIPTSDWSILIINFGKIIFDAICDLLLWKLL